MGGNQANDVSKSTAYRWADEPGVKDRANAIRRRALDRAVGRMSNRVASAADGIIKLARTADSEAVKLSALRAIYGEMIAVSRFGGLESRVAALEEQARDPLELSLRASAGDGSAGVEKLLTAPQALSV